MMTTRQPRGFILSMVLITLILTALILSCLTLNTRSLILEANRQQIQAINRNLILSARTWARQQHEPQKTSVTLDTNDLSSRPTELSIHWLDPNHIKVTAQASWSTLNIKQEQNIELWRRHPQTGNELARVLCKKCEWQPKTVKTLISRLLAKQAIGFEKKGREYCYYPKLEEKTCVKRASHSFLQRVFGGAVKPMLAALIEDQKLSPQEVRELKAILDGKRKE